jgi:hypothetical protein
MYMCVMRVSLCFNRVKELLTCNESDISKSAVRGNQTGSGLLYLSNSDKPFTL